MTTREEGQVPVSDVDVVEETLRHIGVDFGSNSYSRAMVLVAPGTSPELRRAIEASAGLALAAIDRAPLVLFCDDVPGAISMGCQAIVDSPQRLTEFFPAVDFPVPPYDIGEVLRLRANPPVEITSVRDEKLEREDAFRARLRERIEQVNAGRGAMVVAGARGRFDSKEGGHPCSPRRRRHRSKP